jgi:hypothetical protein
MLDMFNYYQDSKSINLLKELSNKVSIFAALSGLVVRKSKSFKSEVFLLALVKAANQGKASFNKLAIEMSSLDSDCSISPQALWKRLAREGCLLEQFIGKCIALVTSHAVVEAKQHEQKFQRILTEDSSFVKMLKACASLFPAHGNKHGNTAGVKLNLIYDLLTGESVELSSHAATTQDRSIAYDVIDIVRKGDLVLRDMGYFSVKLFSLIEQKSADWLSRVPRSVNIFTNKDNTLESLLKSSKSGLIDRQIKLTEEHASARLIAVRKTKQHAEKSVRELKQEFKKKGKTPSQKAIQRVQWHLLVTSVSKEKMTGQELGRLYGQRWQIEIIFKAWKQSGNLSRSLSKKSGYQHMLGIFLAEVFRLALIMQSYARLRRKSSNSARLSISKLSDWISTQIGNAQSISSLLKNLPPFRLISTQKRTRKSQLMSMLELLG